MPMPIGIPKVPFLVPGDEDLTWIDLYNRLYWERYLFLFGYIKDETVNQLVGLMLMLGLEDRDEDLHLLINSRGGTVPGAFAIFDVMQTLGPETEIQTTNIGFAGSMAALILAGGTDTKRFAFGLSRVHMCYPGYRLDPMKKGKEEKKKDKPPREKPKPNKPKPKTKPKPKPIQGLEFENENKKKDKEEEELEFENKEKPFERFLTRANDILLMRRLLEESFADVTGNSLSVIRESLSLPGHFMTAQEAKAYGIVDVIGATVLDD